MVVFGKDDLLGEAQREELLGAWIPEGRLFPSGCCPIAEARIRRPPRLRAPSRVEGGRGALRAYWRDSGQVFAPPLSAGGP